MTGTTPITVLSREFAEIYGWAPKISREVVKIYLYRLTEEYRDESCRYPNEEGMKIIRAEVRKAHPARLRPVVDQPASAPEMVPVAVETPVSGGDTTEDVSEPEKATQTPKPRRSRRVASTTPAKSTPRKVKQSA